jgi:hypothetical protein
MIAEAKTTPSIFTHNGRFTVRSAASGEHRTFLVRTQKDDANFAPGERIVYLLTGDDNESDYTGFGFVAGSGVRVWRKKQDTQFERLARMLERLPELEASGKCDVMAETKCRRCNRTLTTPQSVESGIGPVCDGRE